MPKEGIAAAVSVIEEYGMTDGAHHKQWILDQVLRAILGAKGYDKWLSTYNATAQSGEWPEWDQGVAP